MANSSIQYSCEVTLLLSPEEASFLQSVLQNPLEAHEDTDMAKNRETIWEALSKANNMIQSRGIK